MHLGDEKRMAYRKRIDSNAEISFESPSEDSSEELSSDNQNAVGFNPETHKKLIKDIISGLLDGQLTEQFKHVQFRWTKPDGPEFWTVMDPAFIKKQ